MKVNASKTPGPLTMQQELNSLNLCHIRELFLREMKAFLIALETETPEQIRQRLQTIKEIDRVLEEKKKAIKNSGN